jgi:hypothetical protein
MTAPMDLHVDVVNNSSMSNLTQSERHCSAATILCNIVPDAAHRKQFLDERRK